MHERQQWWCRPESTHHLSIDQDGVWYREPFWRTHKPFEQQIGSPEDEGCPFLRPRLIGLRSPYRPIIRILKMGKEKKEERKGCGNNLISWDQLDGTYIGRPASTQAGKCV